MILFYKNSFLASVLSILGCICILVVAVDFSYYSADVIVPAITAGIALLICGKLVSNEKVFKTWWKKVRAAGLEEQIKTDASVARMVYEKYPKKRTLKEIAKLNPEAAAQIKPAK